MIRPISLFLAVLVFFPFSRLKADVQLDSLDALVIKYENAKSDSTIYFMDRYLELAEKEHRVQEIMKMHSAKGKFYARKGLLDSALRYFKFNLEMARKLNKEEAVSRASINIGNIYTTQGKYNSAIDRYLEALRIIEKSGNKKLLTVNYVCLGITYYYLKQYENSLQFYQKALAIYDEQKEKQASAYCYNTMGIIYKETGNTAKALDCFLRTDAIAREEKDSSILSHNLGNLGELYGMTGRREKAIASLEEGIRLTRRFEDFKGLGENLVLLGNVQVKFAQYEKAIATYNETLSLAGKVGVPDMAKNSYLGLSEAYSAMKNFKMAADNHKAFARLKDSLFNVTSSMQIADMQTRYETEKKEQENVILSKENNIQSMQIEKQRNQRNFLIVGFILVFLLGVLIYSSTRLKHQNKLLAEKELRTRAVFQAQEKEKMHLSKELHDGLGPLLSLIKLNASSVKAVPENEKLLADIKELTNESIKEVRGISHALMPSLLQKQGLQAALTDFFSQVEQTGTLKVKFDHNVSHPFASETEVHIYRIVQEAVNNTIKHAGATEVAVSISQKNSGIELLIADNGKGFDLSNNSNGNGLNNIYSRVDFLKGTISMENKKGTTIKIQIPSHA